MNVFHPSIRIDKSGGDGGVDSFDRIYIDGENNVENIFVYKKREREEGHCFRECGSKRNGHIIIDTYQSSVSPGRHSHCFQRDNFLNVNRP